MIKVSWSANSRLKFTVVSILGSTNGEATCKFRIIKALEY
jgi:hypothetical protein